jgi:hypothetical protein
MTGDLPLVECAEGNRRLFFEAAVQHASTNDPVVTRASARTK